MSRQASIVLIIFMTMLGCRTTPPRRPADIGLECSRTPYQAIFRKGEKQLVYIAARHGHGPESDNATFRDIRLSLEQLKPQIVVIEHSIPITAPSSMPDHNLTYCESVDFERCGEEDFARSLARSAGADYVGGEPSDKDIISALQPLYKIEDFACFKWMVQVAGVGTRKDFSENNPDGPSHKREFERALEHQMGIHYTFDDFLACYRAKMGEMPDLQHFSTDMFKPSDGRSATFFQKIMFEMDKGREPHITSVIKQALETKDRVLVVYGSGHFVNERSTLESWLGPAEVRCE